MKRVFYVKLRCDTGYSFVRAEIVAESAEGAIRRAKANARRETGETHSLVVKLKHRGAAV